MSTFSLVTDAALVSAGLLVARVVLGLLIAAHGSQKLFGWFGGYGLAGTGGYFESLGFRPGRTFAAVAGLAEFVSGLLIATGFLGPVGPAIMLSVMIVAAVSVHVRHGVFASANGIEVPLLYGVGAVALALTGPGLYAVDVLLGITPLWTPALVLAVLVAGVVGGIGNLVLRRPAPAARTA
jgi:putative oxidoreductase